MNSLSLLSAILILGVVYAQSCPPTEVVFLLDQSENARRASTENGEPNFNLLQEAMSVFLGNPSIKNLSARDARIGVYGYSGSATQSTYIPEGSTPTQALSLIRNIGQGLRGGSRTYRGLEMIQSPPSFSNNLVVIISSQGQALSTTNGQEALTEYARVTGLGWRVRVIAVQGEHNLNIDELSALNGGVPPVVVDDHQANQTRSYRLLPQALTALINNDLCPPSTTTSSTAPPPVTKNVNTTTGLLSLCDDCISNGGFTLRTDPQYCDRYYVCLAGKPPINQLCPAGTFFDGDRCTFRDRVNCPTAQCDASTQGRVYESGRCCNKYYSCVQGKLLNPICPINQVFDPAIGACSATANVDALCKAAGKYICDVPPTQKNPDCRAYSEDPTGDPCVFYQAGWKKTVPAGTVWNQQACSLVRKPGVCPSGISNRDLFIGPPANVCTMVFRTTFFQGSRDAYNPRRSMVLNLYSILQEARMENNGVVFDSAMTNPFLYYFFFNNLEFPVDTAFRVRFKLQGFTLNTEYDILSNNYCDKCPETISFSVRATSPTSRVVTAKFAQKDGNVVSTSIDVNNVNANDLLELMVIYGDTEVYGQVNVLDENNPDGTPLQTVDLPRVGKTEGATIATNKCGLQFGRGPNQNFLGIIDDFSLFESCQDIESVLN